jgi:hypothetical protein
MRLTLLLVISSAILIALPTQAHAADSTSVPQKALDEMAYRVGQWTSVGFTDGEEQSGPGHEVTKWEPGKYCIRIRAHFFENDIKIHASAVVGWDAESKQLAEHWYTSDGSYMTFRYSLDKKKDSWVGTFAWTSAEGKTVEGPSVVEKKTQDEWVWNASYEIEGEKHSWRSINRRVKK